MKTILILLELIFLFHKNTAEVFLTFPPSAPTRLQMIAGFGVPVDLELESVTVGYVFKTEYWLPVNASNYLDILGHPFNPTPNPITGRKRRNIQNQLSDDSDRKNISNILNSSGYDEKSKLKYEKYAAEVVEVPENSSTTTETIPLRFDEDNGLIEGPQGILEEMQMKQPNNLDTSRWALYKGMERLVEAKGLNGRSCVLRTICEAAHAPFTYSGGILSELMHILLTPSSTTDELVEHSDNEYLKAEMLGESGAPCDQVFKECQRSLLEEFSGIYETFENIMRSLG